MSPEMRTLILVTVVIVVGFGFYYFFCYNRQTMNMYRGPPPGYWNRPPMMRPPPQGGPQNVNNAGSLAVVTDAGSDGPPRNRKIIDTPVGTGNNRAANKIDIQADCEA